MPEFCRVIIDSGLYVLLFLKYDRFGSVRSGSRFGNTIRSTESRGLIERLSYEVVGSVSEMRERQMNG